MLGSMDSWRGRQTSIGQRDRSGL